MQESFLIEGSKGKFMAADLHVSAAMQDAPILVYAHGFNGFKDWGNGNLLVQQLVNAGFAVLKFNFSHNGTTPADMEEFVDLDAFSENNYTIQLYDLTQVLHWITNCSDQFRRYINPQKIGLIGHSMGGGMAILQAATDNRIKALCTWAAIGVCNTPWGSWPEAQMQEWQTSGVAYYFNGRTRQNLPMGYQLYLDYAQHTEALDIHKAAKSIKIPWLICHGKQDSSVQPAVAEALHKLNSNSKLFMTEGDHVFDRSHPWLESTLPAATNKLLKATSDFFTFTLC